MIEEKKLHRPILYIPKSHDVQSQFPDYGEYQLIDWNDWKRLSEQPIAMMRATMFLFSQVKKALLWWQNPKEPFYLERDDDGAYIAITPFVALFDGYVIVNSTLIKKRSTDEWEFFNRSGHPRRVSAYVRPLFKSEEKEKRSFRNDRLGKPLDTIKPVEVEQNLSFEFKTVWSDENTEITPNLQMIVCNVKKPQNRRCEDMIDGAEDKQLSLNCFTDVM